MRKSFAAAFVVVVTMWSSVSVFAQQGALTGGPQSEDVPHLRNFRLHVRNANTGELAGSTTSTQAGQFSFASLQPGDYVVEIVDAAGKMVGLSPSISASAGSTVTVTVGATAAGALAASVGGNQSLVALGPLASVAVAGAASPGAVTAIVATRAGRIVICHKVSATVTQTLEIKESQRESHMAEGDTLGACPASPGR
jgi:hypothetical protein